MVLEALLPDIVTCYILCEFLPFGDRSGFWTEKDHEAKGLKNPSVKTAATVTAYVAQFSSV